MSYWRDKSRRIVREVIASTEPGPARAAALRDAYPFGERRYHPYKIWLDEIRRQTGRKVNTGPCGVCGHARGSHMGRYGGPAAKCHAADCTCSGYRVGHPAQAPLPGI